MKKYATMNLRGGLKEALKTKRSIDPNLAEYLIEIGIYKKYAYDERIKATRYIFKYLAKNWKVPTWLLEINEGEPNEERQQKPVSAKEGKTSKDKADHRQ